VPLVFSGGSHATLTRVVETPNTLYKKNIQGPLGGHGEVKSKKKFKFT